MESVDGIGGVFIYADDPASLAEWYNKFLGIELTKNEDGSYYHVFVYRHLSRPGNMASTTWAIFPAEHSPLPRERKAMVNYRVNNLDAFIKQLQSAGIRIEKVEDYDYGRFAWLKDPEDNPIELFEDRFDYSEYDEPLDEFNGYA